ncbi:hypothetical protein KIN20_037551 [Parelaphostrongylus tenuis]|uniref:Uncharacterized protein n=1 Tax=Parelaphostrongylus tenuis TaxID=148309 RepID=A0AAD5REV2_PARTN|nr:hypothetical protein KIN20_037551 [Parelaphostrongylus tenuis]
MDNHVLQAGEPISKATTQDERVETDDTRNVTMKILIYNWIYSPSGLYAVDFDYTVIN